MQATYKQRRFLRALKAQHPFAFHHVAGTTDVEAMTLRRASEVIDGISKYVVYNPGSQRAKIAEILRDSNMGLSAAIRAIEPNVGQKPLLWSRNSNGQRIPLPLAEQKVRMRQTVKDVWQEMQNKPLPPQNSSDEPGNGSANTPSGDSQPDWLEELKEAMSGDGNGSEGSESDGSEGDGDGSEGDGDGDGEAEAESDAEQTPEQEAETFLKFVRKARRYWEGRNADGITAEAIGMRPALNGAKMIRSGIPARAAVFSMSIHWPQDARDALGVKDYDVLTFQPERVAEISARVGESVHAVLPYVLTLAKSGIPVCLIGTHGTGKTEIARQLASAMGLKFGFASMTEGTPPSTFYGRVFPEHVQSVFEDCYANGGVFLFDEMDAAHPNLLLIVNAALANGKFSNTATGSTITMHPDFTPVCAMNTTGMGADRNYTGRKRLDAAALDRWHMGRVKVPIDENLESALYKSILADSSDELEAIPTMDESSAVPIPA